MTLSDIERLFIAGQWVGHLATASGTGVPDLAVVTLVLTDGDSLFVVGDDIRDTTKYRNVQNNPWACVVIDDVPSVNPFRPRGLKVVGTAALDVVDGRAALRIDPQVISTWGLDGSSRGTAVSVRQVHPTSFAPSPDSRPEA